MNRLVVALCCLAALSACTPEPCCEDNSDCASGFCVFGRCTEPCTTDTDCAAGNICARPEDGRGDRGFCRALVEESCVALTALPPEPAPTDAGPPPPPDAGPSACLPDPAEPNDSQQTATPATGLSQGLTICPGDRDYFRLELDEGERIFALAVFEQAEGDLELALEDDAGQVLQLSSSESDNESVSFVAPSSGAYFLRVFGRSPADTADCLLLIDRFDSPPPVDGGPPPPPIDAGPGACLDDNFEDNDALGDARGVVFPVNAITCPDDQEDWFRVPIPSASGVVVTLTSTSHNVDLFTVAGQLVAEGAPVGVGERIELEAEAGELRLRILGNLDDRRAYTLRVTVTPLDPCNDPFEPNNSTASATVSFPIPSNAEICEGGDEDFYALDVTAGERILARISFDGARGDLDMSLLTPGGAVLDLSQGTGDTEQLLVQAPESGRYTLRVFGFGGDTGPYTLEELRSDPQLCIDDGFEENDNRNDAELISPGTLNAQLCPADRDFYAFVAPLGATVRARVLYAGAGLDLRLRALRPGQGVVAQSADGDGEELISFNSTVEGPVFLALDGTPPAVGLAYSLELELLPPGQCVDDALEENDAFAEQVDLPLGVTSAVACLNDLDFFRFTPSGANLSLELTTPGVAATATVVAFPPPPAQPQLLGFVQANDGSTSFPVEDRPITVIVGGEADTPYTLRAQ